MRRLLTSVALAGATALLPVAGLVAVAPAAHADLNQCVAQAGQADVPVQVAVAACLAATRGNLDTCIDDLEQFMSPQAATVTCQLAAKP